VIFTSGGYELDDDASRVDRDAVWAFLSTQAYWNRGRTRVQFEAQLASAWRIVGVYETATGRQVVAVRKSPFHSRSSRRSASTSGTAVRPPSVSMTRSNCLSRDRA